MFFFAAVLPILCALVVQPYALPCFIVPPYYHLVRVAGTMSPTKPGHFPASVPPPSLLLPRIWMTPHFQCHQM